MLLPSVIVILSLAEAYALQSSLTMFEDTAFKKLLHEDTNVNKNCTELPKYIRNSAGSVITDSCVFLYTDTSCDGRSIRIDGRNDEKFLNLYEPPSEYAEHFGRKVQSYRRCNDIESSDKIRVDFYTLPDSDEITLTYQDVCDCMEIPTLTSNFESLYKINNYGNCVNLYTESGCKGKPYTFMGGLTSTSNIVGVSSSPSFQSISPCGNYTNMCVMLYTTVVGFEVRLDEPRLRKPSACKNMGMSATSLFMNNGSSIISQFYLIQSEFTETFETTRNYELEVSNSANISVDAYIDAGFSDTIFGNLLPSIKAGLSGAYTYSENMIEKENNNTKFAKTEKFIRYIGQEISIPPCSRYQANSYVRVLNNAEIEYTVKLEIVGFYKNGKQMKPEDVKKHLGTLHFEEEKGGKVIASSENVAFVNFALESVIEGTGTPIEGCMLVANYVNVD